MRITLVPVLLVVLLAARATAAPGPIEGSPSKGGVRPLTRDAAALLEDGLAWSALMRSQLALLEASDLLVYVTEVFESQPGEPKGQMRFLSAAGGRRYVVVCLARWRLSWHERLVLLAHELQHAVEVASTPAVNDNASIGALYRRIGWESRTGHFETSAACQAAVRMRADLERSRPAPVPATEARVAGPDDDNRGNPRRNRRNP